MVTAGAEMQGWRLRIEHVTSYRYAHSARASYNEVRLVPQTTPRQTTLEARVTTVPAAPQFRYRDYWGTEVVAFEVPGPHESLEVRSTALVEARPARPVPGAGWARLVAEADRFAELLAPSAHTAPDRGLREAACSLRRSDPVATVEAVVDWVNGNLAYVPGVTGVHTPAVDAWHARSGVCQDFAHLALTVLRLLGVPARYTSGYLHPDAGAAPGTDAVGESHAWVEVWTGGWWGIDPTNQARAGERHVVVAHGRDYGDVPPLKGIFAGSAEVDMSVEVLVSRLA